MQFFMQELIQSTVLLMSNNKLNCLNNNDIINISRQTVFVETRCTLILYNGIQM